MTFGEIYRHKTVKEKREFRREMTELLYVKPITLYRWFSNEVHPHSLAKNILSEYFRTPEDELFPPRTQRNK
jgi:hypothetical protein